MIDNDVVRRQPGTDPNDANRLNLVVNAVPATQMAEIQGGNADESSLVIDKNKDKSEGEEDDIDDLTEFALLAISEFMSSAILMILSMGGEMSIGYDDIFGIAFVNGLGEMACIYGFAELKADFNPAVTLTFLITGDCDITHAVVKIVAQLAGGLFGCLLLFVMFDTDNDKTHHFAALKIGKEATYGSAWCAEILLTYIVIFIIFQTAETNGEPGEALAATLSSPLAVGFTVISCVGVAFPLTGASLNPMRALSTAVIGSLREGGLFKDMEVFFLGPIIAGILVGLQERLVMHKLRALYAQVDFHSSTAMSRTSKSKKIEAEKLEEELEKFEEKVEEKMEEEMIKMQTIRPEMGAQLWKSIEESVMEAIENSIQLPSENVDSSRENSVSNSGNKDKEV